MALDLLRAPAAPDVSRETLVSIPIDDVADNPYQYRQDYGDLSELADDIRRNGLLQPPIARRVDGVVQIAFGHRRLRACRLAGLTEFPVFVHPLTDEQMSEYAWSENEKRSETSAVEKARHIQRAISEFGWTQAQAAEHYGIARPTVANLLRLLNLPDGVQEMVVGGRLDQRHARSLLTLADSPDDLSALAASAAEQDLSARALESAVAERKAAIDAEREKQRQIAAVDALGLGVEWLEREDYRTGIFRPAGAWTNAELLAAGECAPGVCDCLRLHYLPGDDWRLEAGVCPCPEDAPNVVWACCQDSNARAKWQELQRRQADPPAAPEDPAAAAERARLEEEQAEQRRAAEDERRRREEEAAKLIDAILDRWGLDELWGDMRFWGFVMTYARYAVGSAFEDTAILADFQYNLLRSAIVIRSHDKDRAIGYSVDLLATQKQRSLLVAALESQ